MKNKIIFIVIILLVFMILLIPLRGSYAFYSDNKNLEIINTRVGNWKSTIDYLRINDKSNNLSSTIQGDMYRYQGTDDVANWICFGTTKNCGTNDDLVDKNMYRIIGITPEGELYLLKETFIKEENKIDFSWNDKYYVDSSNLYYCDNGKCPEWNEADLFKRLNGTVSNGGIFIGNSEYEYMAIDTKWYNLISDHDWMYGDAISGVNAEETYTKDYIYEIETGKAETNHYVGTKGNIIQETYTWSEKVTAKISLMYMHDCIYSYYDGLHDSTRGNPENMANVKNSWIHYQKDGYNSSSDYEWLSTRWGVYGPGYPTVWGRDVQDNGGLGYGYIRTGRGVRPVFYLSSKVRISYGNGTKDNPFILDVTE